MRVTFPYQSVSHSFSTSITSRISDFYTSHLASYSYQHIDLLYLLIPMISYLLSYFVHKSKNILSTFVPTTHSLYIFFELRPLFHFCLELFASKAVQYSTFWNLTIFKAYYFILKVAHLMFSLICISQSHPTMLKQHPHLPAQKVLRSFSNIFFWYSVQSTFF